MFVFILMTESCPALLTEFAVGNFALNKIALYIFLRAQQWLILNEIVSSNAKADVLTTAVPCWVRLLLVLSRSKTSILRGVGEIVCKSPSLSKIVDFFFLQIIENIEDLTSFL